MLKFSIPFPVTVNHYWGNRGKMKFLTERAKEFRADVLIAFKLHLREKCIARGVYPLKGKLAVLITVFFPDRIKRDLDNLLKSTLDALEHAGVFVNDSQIKDLRIVASNEIKYGGGCVIEVEEKEYSDGHE